MGHAFFREKLAQAFFEMRAKPLEPSKAIYYEKQVIFSFFPSLPPPPHFAFYNAVFL